MDLYGPVHEAIDHTEGKTNHSEDEGKLFVVRTGPTCLDIDSSTQATSSSQGSGHSGRLEVTAALSIFSMCPEWND